MLNYAIDFGALTHVEIANMDAQRAQIHETGTIRGGRDVEPKEASRADVPSPSIRHPLGLSLSLLARALLRSFGRSTSARSSPAARR